MNFDKENIHPKAIQTIRQKYRDNQDFKPEKISVASKAAESVSIFLVTSLNKYFKTGMVFKLTYIFISKQVDANGFWQWKGTKR